MASSYKNLSDFSGNDIPSAAPYKYAIIVAEWNGTITESLFMGAYDTLIKYDAQDKNIVRVNVPGSFELPSAAEMIAQSGGFDAIICIGCVIQGETKHFDFICNAVANGLTQLSIKHNKPVVFGVLTPNTMQQALDRAGGKHGNKGDEAAVTAIKMAHLKSVLKSL